MDRIRLTTEVGTPALTERQQEVVALVAEGLSNREIAERLNVEVSTVKGHLERIYNALELPQQLGGGNRVRVAAWHWGRELS